MQRRAKSSDIGAPDTAARRTRHHDQGTALSIAVFRCHIVTTAGVPASAG